MHGYPMNLLRFRSPVSLIQTVQTVSDSTVSSTEQLGDVKDMMRLGILSGVILKFGVLVEPNYSVCIAYTYSIKAYCHLKVWRTC